MLEYIGPNRSHDTLEGKGVQAGDLARWCAFEACDSIV